MAWIDNMREKVKRDKLARELTHTQSYGQTDPVYQRGLEGMRAQFPDPRIQEQGLHGGMELGSVGGVPVSLTDLIPADFGANALATLGKAGVAKFGVPVMAALSATAIGSKASQGARLSNIARAMKGQRGVLNNPEMEKSAIEHFGTTLSPDETGFITDSGKRLDLSGRHYASGYEKTVQGYKPTKGNPDYLKGERSVDHRELGDFVPEDGSQWERLATFMDQTGSVRYMPNTGISVLDTNMPNIEQVTKAVQDFRRSKQPMNIDIDTLSGSSRASKEFENPTVESVMEFIKSNQKKQATGVPLSDLIVRKEGGKAMNLPYQIEHKPMTIEGGASPLHDLTTSFGDDIYGRNALEYFGSGDPREKSTLRILQSLRGKPDAMVTIYRGAPANAGGINAGDWVTLDRKVAQDYVDLARENEGKTGKVFAQQVPASHVTSWPDSLLEFGYHPKGK